MTQEAQKHLERARRSLEKNKLQDAANEYLAVLEAAPTNVEALQSLADIFTRMGDPGHALRYQGLLFDGLVESGDAGKATALYSRFLRQIPQPPERLARYATLLQRQNRSGEGAEQFALAAQMFGEQGKSAEAVACLEKAAQFDPENPVRQLALGEAGERTGQNELAARGYLRAGQLAHAAGDSDRALQYFERAYKLAPQDRTAALLFAEARLRRGDATGAIALLEPLSSAHNDPVFLGVYGEALLRIGKLDRARQALEAHSKQKPEGFTKLFELASAYLRAGREGGGITVLNAARKWMYEKHRENEFAAHLEHVAAQFPSSTPLAEMVAKLYEELNRETKYFDALVRLFDLYLAAGRVQEACDCLERLVDIDPYDHRNHDRIARLEGKADSSRLAGIQSRAAKAANVSTRPAALVRDAQAASPATTLPEDARMHQALDDMLVQVEIFLQYSLQPKAIERLQRVAELFPREEERNERLRSLYERAGWWPPGAVPKKRAAPEAPPVTQHDAAPAIAPPAFSAETHRDLAAIAEITRLLYRQATSREVLSAALDAIGRHLGVARCLVTVGSPPGASQLVAEYAAPGLAQLGAARAAAVLKLLEKAAPDSLGGIALGAQKSPALSQAGIRSALGVRLTDKETQGPAGALLVGASDARKWKANESFFLQAVGDQLVISATHTRLRSLVRTLAVADERTGLLSRGAYIDCLLAETNRARTQSTPLSLIILQLNRGPDLLRQHGDAPIDQYLEQLARTLSAAVRQTDLAVKYTAWSLAFILPDTNLANARTLAEKLLQTAQGLSAPWDAQSATFTAIAAEPSRRPGDDAEDRVTEWINRLEFGLEDARQRTENSVVTLPTP